MRKLFLVFLLLPFALKAQIISTIAGNGTQGYSGDGGFALAANIFYPSGVARDNVGNIYFADRQNNVIRKISSIGTISTIAGNGFGAGSGIQSGLFSGDGGPAVNAQLCLPDGICVDNAGSVYFCDWGNNRVRKIDASGVISTVAGNGTVGFSGDGGMAVAAGLNMPTGITVDNSGNIYITDNGNHRVRRLNSAGIINTIAGNGAVAFSGDGGPATTASFATLAGLRLDVSGNLYVADEGNNRVRMINSAGIISTVVGNGVSTPGLSGGYSGDGGTATDAALYAPRDIIFDNSGTLYITDGGNNVIRKVTTAGVISTYAGDGSPYFSGDGGLATMAGMRQPTQMAIDNSGTIYFSEFFSHRLRKITSPTSDVEKVNGTAYISYPNPAKDNISVSSGVLINNVSVFNVMSQQVYSYNCKNRNCVNLNISKLLPGLYIFKVNGEYGGRFTKE